MFSPTRYVRKKLNTCFPSLLPVLTRFRREMFMHTLHVPHKACIELTGKDSKKLLQGLCTNDVATLARDESLLAAFLSTKGRIVSEVEVVNKTPANTLEQEQEETLWILTHESDKEHLMRYLKLYKLRSKVKLKERTDVCQKLVKSKDDDVNTQYDKVIYTSNGVDTDQDVHESDYRAYRVYRYLQGLWCDISEIKDKIPLECNMDLLNYISFTKGCYIGQELIARTKYKGAITYIYIYIYIYIYTG